MPLAIGTVAPNFTLKSKTAEGLVDVSLSDSLGKQNVVLAFFPAAFTGVCTTELCDLTGGIAAYKNLNAIVYGISVDSPFALEAWAKEAKIDIPLLSDYKREVSTAYDVLLPDLIGLGPASARAAFLIDKEGVIRYAEQTPTPLEVPDFAKLQEALKALG